MAIWRRFWRWLRWFIAGMNVLIAAALGYLFIVRGYNPDASWDGPAVVTVVLTALAVMLTALAIVIALFAAVGYTTLKDTALQRVGEVADEAMSSRIRAEVAAELDRREGNDSNDATMDFGRETDNGQNGT